MSRLVSSNNPNIDYWTMRFTLERMDEAHDEADKRLLLLVLLFGVTTKSIQDDLAETMGFQPKGSTQQQRRAFMNEFIPNTESGKMVHLVSTLKSPIVRENAIARMMKDTLPTHIPRKNLIERMVDRNLTELADHEAFLWSESLFDTAKKTYEKAGKHSEELDIIRRTPEQMQEVVDRQRKVIGTHEPRTPDGKRIVPKRYPEGKGSVDKVVPTKPEDKKIFVDDLLNKPRVPYNEQLVDDYDILKKKYPNIFKDEPEAVEVLRRRRRNVPFKDDEEAIFYRSHLRLSEEEYFAIANKDFHGELYSDRVLRRKELTARQANQRIIDGYIYGDDMETITHDVQRILDMDKHRAERLIRTETTRVVSEAEIMNAQSRGISYKRHIAILDHRTCNHCRTVNRRLVHISSLIDGVTVPPLHPNCRCILVDVYLGTDTPDDYGRPSEDDLDTDTYPYLEEYMKDNVVRDKRKR